MKNDAREGPHGPRGSFERATLPRIIKAAQKGTSPFTRLWKALLYSLDGLSAALRHEDAFRLEIIIALALVPIALHAPAPGTGKALMVASVMLVLIVELLNSSIEAVVDRISLEEHVLAKRAKDMASAAVMLSLINVPIVWVLVLVP